MAVEGCCSPSGTFCCWPVEGGLTSGAAARRPLQAVAVYRSRPKERSKVRRIGRPVFVLAAIFSAAALVMAPSTVASAAGNGYTPGTPSPGGVAPGLPGHVDTVTTVGAGGGTATGSVGSSTITVTVGPTSFGQPVQVVMTSPPGQSNGNGKDKGQIVALFGLGFYENGSKVTGSFPPVTVTVTSPNIVAGSTVSFIVNGNLVQVPSSQVTAGSATFTISSDPVVEVTNVAGTAPIAITGATAAVTGEPFGLDEILSAFLVLLGIALLLTLRLRRRAA